VPLAGAAIAATKFAADFEQSTTKLITLSGVSADQMRTMRQAVLDMAPAVGIGPEALSQALLVVTSTGFEGAQALDILKLAAQSSAVGMGDTTSIARALTAAISAYGSENLTAAQAADILHQTVVTGGAEATELAGEIGRVVGVASTLGVSFAEVGAFIATYTRLGLSAAEATTGLSGALNMILNPSAEARKALADIGLSAGQLRQMVSQEGLGAALIDLLGRLHGNADAVGMLFGNVRALAGVMGTAGTQAQSYRDNLDKITHSTGSLNTAFETTKKTFAFQWDQFKAQAERAAITLGTQLLPSMLRILEAAKPLGELIVRAVSAFADLPGPVQTGALALAGLAVAAGPVVFAFGSLLQAGGSLLSLFRLLGGATIVTTLFQAIQPAALGAQMSIASLYAVAAAHPFIAIAAAVGGLVFALSKLEGAFANASSAYQQGGWRAVLGELGRNTKNDDLSLFKSFRMDQQGAPRMLSSPTARDINLTVAPEKIKDVTRAVKDLTAAHVAHVPVVREAATVTADMAHAEELVRVAMQHQKFDLQMAEAAWRSWSASVGEGLAKIPHNVPLLLPSTNLSSIVEAPIAGIGNQPSATLAAQKVVVPFRAAFAGLGHDLPGLIFGALQHGGIGALGGALAQTLGSQFSDVFNKALSSVGGNLSKLGGSTKAMGVAGASIGTAIGAFSVGQQYGKAKGALAGAASGAIAGSVVPGIGTAIGAGVGALASWIGGMFNHKGRDAVQDFVSQTFGSFDALHTKLNELGADGERLWVNLTQGVGRGNPQEAKAAIDAVTKALNQQQAKIEAIGDLMAGVNARAQVFGDNLGTKATPGTAATPEEFGRIGALATSAFGMQVQEQGSPLAALATLKPTLDILTQAQHQFGFEVSDTVQRLFDMSAAVQSNLPAFQALDADSQILRAALKANWADMSLFGAASTDAAAQIQKIVNNGVPMAQALALNQPVLQSLWEAQQRFKFTTDESTQSLIDQAVQQGIVGPQMRDVNKQILDVLLAIGKVLGADIPQAMAGLPAAAATAANGVNQAFARVHGPDVNVDIGGGTRAPVDNVEVPGAASGGIVRARPGGTLVNVGEGGSDEAIIPLGKGGGAKSTIILEVDGRTFAEVVVPYIPGEVQRLGLS
jgi:TP901 family phage tail tape measure protein